MVSTSFSKTLFVIITISIFGNAQIQKSVFPDGKSTTAGIDLVTSTEKNDLTSTDSNNTTAIIDSNMTMETEETTMLTTEMPIYPECGVSQELLSLVEIDYTCGVSVNRHHFVMDRSFFDLRILRLKKKKKKRMEHRKKFTFSRLDRNVSFATVYALDEPLLEVKRIVRTPSVFLGTKNLTEFSVTPIELEYERRTCHYNPVKDRIVCVELDNLRMIHIVYDWVEHNIVARRNEIPKPLYLNFDKLHSYADSKGNDFLIVHHKLQWIYKIDLNKFGTIPFLKTYQLLTNQSSDWEFYDFLHADEVGIVSVYKSYQQYRYVYSLFSEVTGMKSFCIQEYDYFVPVAIFATKRKILKENAGSLPVAAAFREKLGLELPSEPVLWSTGFLFLFLLASTYLTLFLGAQFFAVSKPTLFEDMIEMESEMSLLAPVVEPVILQVHQYLKTNGIQKLKKKK